MMRILTILLILFPFSALAEGARMILDCTVVSRCDVAGACGPIDDSWQMQVQPLDIDAEGAGTYAVSNLSFDAEATGQTRTGPFFWITPDNGRVTLSLTGETTALMVNQSFKSGPEAPDTTIDFLNCEVTF